MTTGLRGRILTAGGWRSGRIEFGARIARIDDAPLDGADAHRLVLPGFVDLHVHGALGADVMRGGDAAATIARAHARHGTTSLLATTMTAHEPQIVRALQDLTPHVARRPEHGARILGVHLEGPFLSPHKLGAQPPQVVTATLEIVRRFHAIAPIRVLTLAPEIEGHLALIPDLVAMGIKVQLGHSAGTYEDGIAALDAGATGFTHLFNGMSALNHYAPGIVGAALARAEYAELIPDLEHVSAGALRVALRAIPKAYGVTDATAATGMPDGEYALGSQRVFKCLGCVRLAGGSLAGSALTMDQALRNFVALGLDVAEAARRLSTYPADHLGLADRGRLAVGAHADLVALDAQTLAVERVFVEGEAVPLSA